MGRKVLLAAVFIASFFLVFLGMRNPYLSGDGAPKPRSRAIIENVVKCSQNVAQPSSHEIACKSIPAQFTPPLQESKPEVAQKLSLYSSDAQASRFARAPPGNLS